MNANVRVQSHGCSARDTLALHPPNSRLGRKVYGRESGWAPVERSVCLVLSPLNRMSFAPGQ